MSTDATMIRTGALVGAAPASAQGVRRHARIEAAIAAVAMLAIVGICLFVVVLAANRPSFYAPTTHAGFFPGWLAGPLGGLWPSFPTGSSALKWIWTFGLLAMYAAYVVAFAYVPRLPARWVIAAVVAAHVVMLMAPPLSLTDIFNYIN